MLLKAGQNFLNHICKLLFTKFAEGRWTKNNVPKFRGTNETEPKEGDDVLADIFLQINLKLLSDTDTLAGADGLINCPEKCTWRWKAAGHQQDT